MARMQELVRWLRDLRHRYDLSADTFLPLWLESSDEIVRDFRSLEPFIKLLSGDLKIGTKQDHPDPKGASQPPAASYAAKFIHRDFLISVPLGGIIDLAEEAKRLEKQLVEKMKHLQSARAKLENPNFVDKAPAEVVQAQRDLVADLQAQIKVIEDNLKDLRTS